jgi:putative peptide zinc metalloprotease protein
MRRQQVVPFSRGVGAAIGDVTRFDVTRPDLPAVRAPVPRLLAGVEPLGEYQGSGLTDATFLVRDPEGRVVQVSRLLHLVLSGIDGQREVSEIAARVSAEFGRTVSTGNVEYLLDHKLAPLGLLARADGAPGPANPGWDQGVLTLRFRCTLIPEAGVQFFARLFRPLFTPAVVVAALGGLIVSDVWLVRVGQLDTALGYVVIHPVLLLLVLGLTLLSTLFHECGHAAACRYGGARPGVIGMGVYVVWPAFFTNVTDAYRLGRAGRVRTDLGGVYFNAIFSVGLAVVYLATGYQPLLAAVLLVHVEMVQQLLPSLRFDGYFILADLIGVPDLFRRIGPVLRSLIPGRPADPRVRGLKRGARVTLTAWVLVMVPLIVVELGLTILNAPSLARTFAVSLADQAAALAEQIRRADLPAALLSVFSMVLLVLPMAGLSCILLITGRRLVRSVVAVNRRRPVLWLPSAAMALLVAALLAAHWHLLPPARTVTPRPSAVGDVTAQRPPAAPARPHPTSAGRQDHQARQAHPARQAHRAVLLRPVSAHGFDPLDTQGDPNNENDVLAGYAIDGNPATAWRSQYYLGNPVFGGLKAGSGLILDMGRRVRLRSVTVTFGAGPGAGGANGAASSGGADVAVEIGRSDTLAASTLGTFTTLATADSVAGKHTFRTANPARGRYVLIWFTRLPPAGPNRFQAEVYGITVRGSAVHRNGAP